MCNHLGYIEIVALVMSHLHPSFAPKGDLSNVPLVGPACRGLQSIFLQRPSDGKNLLGSFTRNSMIEQIKER